jgi:hypothetical protein
MELNVLFYTNIPLGLEFQIKNLSFKFSLAMSGKTELTPFSAVNKDEGHNILPS